MRLDQTFHLYFVMIIVQGYALKWPKEKIANEKTANGKERKKKGERKDVNTTNSEKRIAKENIAKNKMSII